MRRMLLLPLLLVALASLPPMGPGIADVSGCEGSPLDPDARYPRYLDEAPGTEREYCIFYGPYVIPGGHDLSRVDFDLSLNNGFVVAGGPSVVLADGSEPSHQTMHIHHSHWWFIDPNDRDRDPLPWMRWISGSGEEVTRGDFRTISDADPEGPRYGIFVAEGDRVAMINMLHNKTTEPMVVWIKVDIAFVHGTAEQILTAPGPYQGKEFRNLTGVLHGSEFDVRRGAGVSGKYTYPRDIASGDDNWGDPSFQPGTGHVWTAPFSGTIVVGAGHLHPGGEKVIATNLGRPGDGCADTRTDGIPGTTLYELEAIDRTVGARFTEDFQIEITQPGFRAEVRAGDRIALNGIYDTVDHAWWDAMSFSGFYIDEHPVADADKCTVGLVGRPPGWVPPTWTTYPLDLPYWEGVPNREWEGVADPLCGPGLGGPCDRAVAPSPFDPVDTSRVVISAFTYLPGHLGSPTGRPRVARGTPLEFTNADMAQYVRHTVTSCPAPCNGDYVANYPLPDGVFDSEYLGWEPTTNGERVPIFTLDTTEMAPGVYTYFCRVHAWMRGSLEIV